jgi:hypothetical protein
MRELPGYTRWAGPTPLSQENEDPHAVRASLDESHTVL